MGPLFVLILWATAACVLSVVGGLALMGLAALLLRKGTPDRKRALKTAAFLPACGFAYLFVCVIIFSIWSSLRGRDMGWGDSWDTPILGAYHLQMIDLTDRGALYNGDHAMIYDVSRMEVRPPFLVGATSPESMTDHNACPAGSLFFILDTRDGSCRDFRAEAALQTAAAQLTPQPLNLRSVDEIYNRYRYTKLDLIPLTLLAVPPLFALVKLARGFLRLRRREQSSQLPVTC